MSIIKLNAYINGISYNPTMSNFNLKKICWGSFDINTTPSACLVVRDNSTTTAVSKWVSPKRTRSYPFERIYNTFHEGKKITVIPILKDEGKDGDQDRVNFITLSWLNLMNVYIVLAYYTEAEANLKNNKNKITNQILDNDYVKQKIDEISQYHSDAHHWNEQHFKNDFIPLLRHSIEQYNNIGDLLNVEMSSKSRLVEFIKEVADDNNENILDLEKFKSVSLNSSEKAALRETQTLHELEFLGDVDSKKGLFNISNNLGGQYVLTCDELIQDSPSGVIIQESKNTSSGVLPSKGDIKDGLFKLILFKNIKSLFTDANEEVEFSVRLKLTGAVVGELYLPNAPKNIEAFFNKNKVLTKSNKQLINDLNQEAIENELSVVIASNYNVSAILKKKQTKSPLRYPGGKSRAIPQILPILPSHFNEYREPMVGGGSLFFALKSFFPSKQYWINDINTDLYYFWLYAKEKNNDLVKKITEIRNQTINGKELFQQYTNLDYYNSLTEFEKAVRFFALNRMTFSGTTDSGGYSNSAYEKRFTESSVERVGAIENILQNVRITNEDYSTVINQPGDDVFIFLDPPYYSATDSLLYGKNGNLHKGFNHEKFAEDMKHCKHKWLITYDDSPEIRELFSFANIKKWTLQYGMNNVNTTTAAKGNELFISNYDFPKGEDKLI